MSLIPHNYIGWRSDSRLLALPPPTAACLPNIHHSPKNLQVRLLMLSASPLCRHRRRTFGFVSFPTILFGVGLIYYSGKPIKAGWANSDSSLIWFPSGEKLPNSLGRIDYRSIDTKPRYPRWWSIRALLPAPLVCRTSALLNELMPHMAIPFTTARYTGTYNLRVQNQG